MKKSKFVTRAVSSLLAAAMLATLASCGPKSPEKGGDMGVSNKPRQIVNYYTSEMFTKPESLGYVNSIFTAGEKVFIYGEKNSSAAEKVSLAINEETKEVKDISIDGIKADYINGVHYFGDRLLVMYQTENDYKNKMALVNTADGTVIKETNLPDNSYVSSCMLDKDGNFAASVQSWGGVSSQSTLRTYDRTTLEEKNSVDLNALVSADGGNSYINSTAFDNDGNLYILCGEYDPDTDTEMTTLTKVKDGTVEYAVDDFSDLENAAFLLKRPNGNMCIMSLEGMSGFVFSEIDNATGEVVNRPQVKVDIQSIRGICQNYDKADLVYLDETGIWKIDADKEKPEKMYSFGTDIPEECSSSYEISYSNGSFYFYGESYGDSRSVIYSFDEDGNELGTLLPELGKDEYVTAVTVNADGKICLLAQCYKYDEETESGSSVYNLYVMSQDGATEAVTDLSSVSIDGADVYVDQIVPLRDGSIAALAQAYDQVAGESKAFAAVIDASGNLISKVEDESIMYIENAVSTAEGDYLFYYEKNKSGTSCIKFDAQTGEILEHPDFELPDSWRSMGTDGNYDFCYQTGEGIYGYTAADKKSTEILNWVDSDILFTAQKAAFLGDDTIICLAYDYEVGDTQIYRLRRADEETLKKIQNKKLITVAGLDLGYDNSFREKIVDFNRNSDEYRIQVNDYGKFSKWEDDTYTSGAFQLNNDMTAGNTPDIIIGNSEIDMTSFAAKKILADLTTYFEKDPDIHKEDFFENIFDAYSYDGKMYQVVSNFSVSAIAGPASKLGSEPGWTHEEFLSLRDNGDIFYRNNYTKDELANRLIKSNLSEFVDFEKKTCDFDNSRFTGLIDLVCEEGREPGEDEDIYDESARFEEAKRFKDGKCQAEIIRLDGFYDILNLQQGALGEEAVIKGFPASEGSGALITSDISFAVCEKSKNKDAAWEFIREFLTEEYQDGLNDNYIHTLPSRKSSFEKLLTKAKNDDSMGYAVEMPDGTMEDMKPLDDKTADKIRAAVEAADRCAVSDERIGKIIDEELEAVKKNGKSSAEAASQIQNKVSLYLKEIK